MKKILSLVLGFAMCFSLVSSALASEVPVNQLPAASPALESEAPANQLPTNRAWDGPPLNPGVELFANATYWYQNDTIWNGRSTNTFYFRLDEDFQYAKIWVQNNSGGPVTLSTAYDGKDFGSSYTIANGATKTIFVMANGNTGAFYANVNAVNGHTLNGLISIKTGTKTGVDYPW